MNLRRPRTKRRAIELLEARECPAVVITAGNNTNLKITGSSPNLVVNQEGATSFRVIDNGTDRGVFSTSKDVVINMGGGNDTLLVDLNVWTTPRDIKINVAAGINTVAVREGTVAGNLSIAGGGGVDTVTVLDQTVNGNLSITGAAGADVVTIGNGADAMLIKGLLNIGLVTGLDSVTIRDLTTVQNNVTIGGANTISLQNGSELLRDLTINSDSKGAAITLAGAVNRDVKWNGTRVNVIESFTLTDLGDIGHDLIINSDGVGEGNGGKDTVTLAGEISGDLRVNTSGGMDTVTLGATLSVGALINVQLGKGNDTCIHAVVVDPGHIGNLNGGLGQDTLTLTTALPALVTSEKFEL